MSKGELCALAASGVVEVGAHSVHHPLLTGLSSDRKAREIVDSRRDCGAMLGRAPAAFAFPNGDLDEECVALVREAGFSLACTSQQDLAWADGNVFLTPRLVVPDVDGPALIRWLHREWLA
jgi:peptidoglycan/xylan/chitin deacetylase (PgdA/CDA1 family)